MIGTRLAHYRLTELIGEGGMGRVYRAVDEELGREVALKLLPPEVADDPVRVRRFQREARAVAALNHPGIVTIHSVGEASGVHFLVLELVQGRPLSALVPPGGLSASRVRQLALPICDALAAAHARGIVHRDLKPSNLMLTDDGTVKVLDFGLAKSAPSDTLSLTAAQGPTETMTSPGSVVGTLPYMSPEQVAGEALDARTDIYSLGIVLFELATGRLPFDTGSAAHLMASILRDSPSAALRSVDEPLRSILKGCLAKSVGDRYASVTELRDALETWRPAAAGNETTRGPTPAIPRAPVPESSGPLAVTRRPIVLVAALAAVVCCALLWLTAGIDRGPRPAAEPMVEIEPIENLTGSEDHASVAEGLHAGLAVRLSAASGITVLDSPTRGDSGPARSTHRVRASLRSGLPEPQIDLQVFDVGLDLPIWSHRFAERQSNWSQVEATIARHLTDVLSVPLSRTDRRRFESNPQAVLNAYEYFLRGHLELRHPDGGPGRLEAAGRLFEQALRLDPDSALAHAGLSEARWRLFHRDQRPDDLAEAELQARAARDLDPELPAAQLAWARVRRTQAGPGASLDLTRELLANHPRPGAAQRELAQGYDEVGDLEEAERGFRAATELDPEDWRSWNALGQFHVRQGRYDEAAAAFERSAALAPGPASWPVQNLAALAILRGDFEGAITAFESIPGPIRDPELASNLATAYFFSSRPERLTRAESLYRQAARLDPANDLVLRNLGDVYQAAGREDDARQSFLAARERVDEKLRSTPHDSRLQLRRLLYAAKAGECEAALQSADALLGAIPENAENLHDLATGYALCGRTEPALDLLERAVEHGFSAEYLSQEPELGSLRSSPRFRDLVSAAGPADS